ncbi:hypothetical protein V8C44DRAFT_323810 [Trichoderma aethiopicum]
MGRHGTEDDGWVGQGEVFLRCQTAISQRPRPAAGGPCYKRVGRRSRHQTTWQSPIRLRPGHLERAEPFTASTRTPGPSRGLTAVKTPETSSSRLTACAGCLWLQRHRFAYLVSSDACTYVGYRSTRTVAVEGVRFHFPLTPRV